MKTVLQDPDELAWFVDLIRREGVRSYLEIGANAGGLMRAVAAVMPPVSRIVAVDIGERKQERSALTAVVAALKDAGHCANVIWGDSTDPAVVKEVSDLAPFDCVFIDANHTLPFVMKDWESYGPMGRMIAFHDIAWRRAPEWSEGLRIAVPEFWNSIKEGFHHEECRLCPTGKNNGIGVLWRC